LDNKLFPPPPQQIAGLPIKVEYTSILAQAQKQLGVQQISRVVGFIQTVVQALGGQDTSIADGIDWDQTLREVCEAEGTPAKMNKDQAVIDQIRAQRAKAQQQQQQMMQAEQAANAANKIGTIPTGAGTLHGAMTGAQQPVGAGK